MCKGGTSINCEASTDSNGGATTGSLSSRSGIVDSLEGDNRSTPSTTPTNVQSQQYFSMKRIGEMTKADDEKLKNDNQYPETQQPKLHERAKIRSFKYGPFTTIMMIIATVTSLLIVSFSSSIHQISKELPLRTLFQNLSFLWSPPPNTPTRYDSPTRHPTSPYMIIIDGGSTGSRLHIFEFVSSNNTTIIERRGSFRTVSPLSSFITIHSRSHSHDDLNYSIKRTALKDEHIVPLLRYIVDVLSNDQQKQFIYTTPIYYVATAGMRLLTLQQQNAMYDTMMDIITEYCRNSRNNNQSSAYPNIDDKECFEISRHHIQTLSGALEGYYGVLATNYLHNKINVYLEPINIDETTSITEANPAREIATATADASKEKRRSKNGTTLTGALDMGGSSTQIVFYTLIGNEEPPDDTDEITQECINIDGAESGTIDNDVNTPRRIQKKQLQEHHFFSMSYLSYGVDQFRERLWSLLLYEYHQHESTSKTNERRIHQGRQKIVTLLNPCSSVGHNITTFGSAIDPETVDVVQLQQQEYLLVGTGDVHLCKQYMKKIIPHPVDTPIQHIYDRNFKRDDNIFNLTDDDENSSLKENIIGGIKHPPIYNELKDSESRLHHDSPTSTRDEQTPTTAAEEGGHQDFIAMSLYFFTFDSIRVFTNNIALNEKWPKPTLEELEDATIQYCSMNLVHDIYPLYDNHPQRQPHKYTRKDIVQHRCMEAIYMISLLEEFGFKRNERHITFAFDINGSEVEWTLGMALQIYSDNKYNEGLQQKATCSWDNREM